LKSGGGGHYLIRWEVEGSSDGRTWTTLDRRNSHDLRGAVRTFECSKENELKSFRYIRLRQTGMNSGGNDALMLCNVEFFGNLK
jgi:hypothetical protein